MRARLHWVLRAVARLTLAEKGAAAVEFALILPVMLVVYLGTLEASTLITMDRKVQSVAGAVGDLVADWKLVTTFTRTCRPAQSGNRP